jgi:hypothetical protein
MLSPIWAFAPLRQKEDNTPCSFEKDKEKINKIKTIFFINMIISFYFYFKKDKKLAIILNRKKCIGENFKKDNK